jgi:hypothetical protein
MQVLVRTLRFRLKDKHGPFSKEDRGRCYFKVTTEVSAEPKARVPLTAAALGTDVGLKSLMRDSGDQDVQAQHSSNNPEGKIAVTQRAGEKVRVRAHCAPRRPTAAATTSTSYRTMLRYTCRGVRTRFRNAGECYTTQEYHVRQRRTGSVDRAASDMRRDI